MHYFVMGESAGWRAAESWPPADQASHTAKLYLLCEAEDVGSLEIAAPSSSGRSLHIIDETKCPQVHLCCKHAFSQFQRTNNQYLSSAGVVSI